MSERDRIDWEEVYERRTSADAEPAAFLVDHVELLRPGCTLDLAAGSGGNALFLAARGHKVVAVDVAGTALRHIRERNRAVDLVQVDLDRPCFHAASFDNVLCVNFLDRELFPSMLEWVRPGGVVLVDTFSSISARSGIRAIRRFSSRTTNCSSECARRGCCVTGREPSRRDPTRRTGRASSRGERLRKIDFAAHPCVNSRVRDA